MLGFIGLDFVYNWHNVFFFLAECVPLCGYALVWSEKPSGLGGGDFHDMGGEYYRGAKLVKWEKSQKAFAVFSTREGKPGINFFLGEPIPFRKESEHVLITGSPGSGKTQMIYSWLEEVYNAGIGPLYGCQGHFHSIFCWPRWG